MRLSDLGSQYLKWFAQRNASPKTIESYDLAYTQFVAFLIGLGQQNSIESFTPEHIDAFIGHLTQTGRKASSVNIKLSALHSLGEYGKKSKDGRGKYYLAENPLDRIVRPKEEPVHERYLTLVEIRQLLAHPKPAACQIAIEILVDVQLRASELTNANVEHARLDGDRVVLAVRVKGNRFKEVTLGQAVSARLLEALKFREARPSDPLVVNEKGHRYTRTTLSEMILRQAKRAGITRFPVRAHVLGRHSVATLASESKVEIPVIAGMLNHSDLNTVQKYVHRNAAVDAAREAVREALR